MDPNDSNLKALGLIYVSVSYQYTTEWTQTIVTWKPSVYIKKFVVMCLKQTNLFIQLHL
jgi:hypothetical protein